MTNMFKKSLVAIALTSVSAGAMAAGLNSDQIGVSTEWVNVATGTQTVAVPNFTYKMGASYTVNDIIEFTFTGDSIDVGSLNPTVLSSVVPDFEIARLSTRLNDNGDRVVLYRVTKVGNLPKPPAGEDQVYPEFDFGSIGFAARAINGTVSVVTSAETSTGQPLDSKATRELVYVGTQYARLNGGFSRANAVIDVGSSRTQFTRLDGTTYLNPVATGSNARTAFSVTGVVPREGDSSADPQVTPIYFNSDYMVTPASIEYVLSGDFSFLLDDEGEYDASGDVTVAIPCDSEFEVDASSISFVCPGSAGGGTSVQFDVAPESSVTLPAQTFGIEASVAYSYSGSQGTANFNQSAGTWSLNGSNVEVAYMPYSGNITQVINVTNRSAQTGDISVTAIDEAGRRFDLGVIAQSDARSITPIAGQIREALSAETGIDLASNSTIRRYALEITTNAPQGAVEVYTAYNVGQTGARLVVNSSNGGAGSKSD